MKPRTRRSANIALIEFLRPDGYWPSPYSLEMAFQALRWLIASARGEQYVTRHQWHRTCAVGLMGGRGAVNGAGTPVKSLADLQRRFQLALLAGANGRPEVARWREDKGIHVDAVVTMAFRHYKPFSPPLHLPFRSEAAVHDAVNQLLEKSAGKILTTQLNSVHAGAKVIHNVDVSIGHDGFDFTLRYGFVDPAVSKNDSEWAYSLASTEADEPFLDTLARAIAKLDQLTAIAMAEDEDTSAHGATSATM